jgi:hypothetical protein
MRGIVPFNAELIIEYRHGIAKIDPVFFRFAAAFSSSHSNSTGHRSISLFLDIVYTIINCFASRNNT